MKRVKPRPEAVVVQEKEPWEGRENIGDALHICRIASQES
jgi:hypothetical protein